VRSADCGGLSCGDDVALAANANGTATATVTLKDNGGTAHGGLDTSAPQTFAITVKPWYQVYLPVVVRTQ